MELAAQVHTCTQVHTSIAERVESPWVCWTRARGQVERSDGGQGQVSYLGGSQDGPQRRARWVRQSESGWGRSSGGGPGGQGRGNLGGSGWTAETGDRLEGVGSRRVLIQVVEAPSGPLCPRHRRGPGWMSALRGRPVRLDLQPLSPGADQDPLGPTQGSRSDSASWRGRARLHLFLGWSRGLS